jgi:uncharacterized protein DUF3375
MAKIAERLYYEFGANAATDVAMSLLRSKGALLYLALMAAHLGDGQIVDGLTLTALMDEDLVDLREGVGAEDQPGAESSVAENMLRKWTRKGWVHRSVDPETRIERYQLTSGASQAVRQMRGLRRHNSTATESALSMVMTELRQIASQANPDPAARVKMLDEQIKALVIERQIIERDGVAEVNYRDLIDRIAALAHLVERIPLDVARYGEEMHANTAALLRQSLADDPAEFAGMLARMFDGHDVIAESPEGQAFRAFTHLVGMPSQRAQLEADIAEILLRVSDLPAHLEAVLSNFIDMMWQRVQEVEGVRKGAFRRISNFVRGGDALHYRSMRTRVAEAQASAAEAFRTVHPNRDIGFAVPLSGVVTRSVGRLRLDDGEASLPDPVTDSSGEFKINPATLAGRESIDWAALRAAVNDALDQHGGFATLPEVLSQIREPRTGEIIGIWALASRHGDVDDASCETVWAHTSRGLRQVSVPYLVFGEYLLSPVMRATRRTLLEDADLTASDRGVLPR